MTSMWYCPTCGYEVDRGGRCHNCREPLLPTDLTELAEGEADEEVGYRLDGWEDETRGALIEQLVDRGIRHRFEGDELVVSADDEERVDAVVGEVTGALQGEAGPAGGVDPTTWDAVEALYGAAARLSVDPTDMHADGDLAEASAAIFGTDEPAGVDPETWSAIGRVTRRLLGALGSDEALEDQIRTQSSILCRLAGPIVDMRRDGRGLHVERTAGRAGHDEEGHDHEAHDHEAHDHEAHDHEAHDGEGRDEERHDAEGHGETLGEDEEVVEAEEGDEGGDAGDETYDDAGDGEGAGRDDGDDDEEDRHDEEDNHDELVYELDDWLPEERAQLGILLDRDGIVHAWEGSDLVVASADEDAIEPLFDEVDRSGGVLDEAPPGSDDELEYQVLSDLFGAADRLAGDPEDSGKRRHVVEAAGAVSGWGTPFGLSDEQWWQVRNRAQAVSESIENDADPDVVASRAASLSDLLRGYL